MTTPQVTASVGVPTEVPERPTLYLIVFVDERGYWAVDSMHGVKDFADMKHTTRPSSVLVTIPGSRDSAPASGESGPYTYGETPLGNWAVAGVQTKQGEYIKIFDTMEEAKELATLLNLAVGRAAPSSVSPCLRGEAPAAGVEAAPDANVEAVRGLLLERARRGQAKYGVTTERTDIDLAGWLTHLQEELLDAAVYVQRLKGEAAAGAKGELHHGDTETRREAGGGGSGPSRGRRELENK